MKSHGFIDQRRTSFDRLLALRLVVCAWFLAGANDLAYAQSVFSLYQESALKTQILLPFQLQDTSKESLPIERVELTTPSQVCSIIIDPNITTNFLLRCSSADSPTVLLTFFDKGIPKKIEYGPIPITDSVLPLLMPSQSTPTAPSNDEGRNLFEAQCQRCHQSPTDKANRSANTIQTALNNISTMKGIKLSAEEVTAISEYLKDLN